MRAAMHLFQEMPPKIKIEKAIDWRERARLVYGAHEAGKTVAQIAAANGIHQHHVRRLLRVCRALGMSLIEKPQMGPISLVGAEKLCGMSPKEKAMAIREKKPRRNHAKEIKIIVGGKEVTPAERAKMIREMIDSGMRKYEIAARFGVDAGSITRWIVFASFIPPVQRAIEKGEISISSARVMTGMSEAGQAFVWTQHRSQFSTLGVRQLAALIREKYPAADKPDFYRNPESAAIKEEQRLAGRWSKTDECQAIATHLLKQIC